jgi:hypothetical protein
LQEVPIGSAKQKREFVAKAYSRLQNLSHSTTALLVISKNGWMDQTQDEIRVSEFKFNISWVKYGWPLKGLTQESEGTSMGAS